MNSQNATPYSIFQRILALIQILFVCAIARLFGTADATIAAILLLVIFRRSVVVQMLKTLISWQARYRKVILFSVIIWICILVLTPLLSLAGISKPDYSIFTEQIHGNSGALATILLKVWTTVAFGEEILGRVFLIDRFEAILKRIPGSTILSVVMSSVLFGLAHDYQGPGGIMLAGSLGLILSILYLNQKRTIWTNVVVHGTVDTIAMLLVFFGVKFW